MNTISSQKAIPIDLTINPGITSPTDNTIVDFSEPLQITWDSRQQEVIRFYLRVGTEDGKWDIMSAEVGTLINHLSLDISALTQDVDKLYLKLAYTQMVTDKATFVNRTTKESVTQDIVEEREMEPELPLVIHRKKEIAA